VLATSARLLRLLGLLQARPRWSGPELADRLGVTGRTVRNDIDRLRRLGYRVDATPGPAGGYRLTPGAAVPPLLLDDDEAVAVGVGLGLAAAGGAVNGIEEASTRAVAKLTQVLPARLRHRITALDAATLAIPPPGPTADAEVLATLARLCRDAERLRFDYRDHDGTATVRTVDPHRLVHARARWYLVAWDVDRDGWRTFRADRIEPRRNTGPRVPPRDPPGGDLAAYVTRGLATAMWRVRARVVVHAPADVVAARLPPGAGMVEAVDEHTCAYEAGAETVEVLAHYIGLLGADVEVDGPPELTAHFAVLAGRYRRAAGVPAVRPRPRAGGLRSARAPRPPPAPGP